MSSGAVQGASHGPGGVKQESLDVDLVPLIDCVFLLLLFFMLCGRMALDNRAQQITVPPTKTAVKFDSIKHGWGRIIVNIFGNTQSGNPPRNSISVGDQKFIAKGIDDYTAYQGLRALLDQVYDKAEKYDDPKGTGLKLPKVIIELRADADTEYRVVQEVQQVVTDVMDLTNMQPKKNFNPATQKCFVNIDFTTRRPQD